MICDNCGKEGARVRHVDALWGVFDPLVRNTDLR